MGDGVGCRLCQEENRDCRYGFNMFLIEWEEGGKGIGSELCSLCLRGRGGDFRMQTNMCLLNNE